MIFKLSNQYVLLYGFFNLYIEEYVCELIEGVSNYISQRVES